MRDEDWYDLQTFGHYDKGNITVIGDISSNHMTDDDIFKSINFLRSRGCLIKLQAYPSGMFPHLENWTLSRELMKKISADDVFYSVFDRETVDWLEKEVNPKYYKLSCRSMYDQKLIEKVRSLNKPTFQSIPYGDGVVDNSLPFKKLFCVSEYPARKAHLRCFRYYFNGYSDHTMNPIVPALAVAMGAKIIEHHFSIREMDTPDKCVSYLPEQWDEMLKNIRNAESHL